MNNYRRIKLLLLFFFLLQLSTVSKAEWWGAGGFMETGSFNLASKPYLFPERKASGTVHKKGAAVIADTGPSPENIYSFRFNLNLSRGDLVSSDFDTSESIIYFNMDAALGIGLVSKPGYRVWFGPELRFGVADGTGTDFTHDASSGIIGFGFLAGTDIYASDRYGISLTAGVLIESYRNNSQLPANNTLRGESVYASVMVSFIFQK